MGGHDGGDDGEPQPTAASGAGPGRVGPVEALEDALRVLVGHARAGVAHLDLGLVADLVDVHRGGRPRRRVRPDVGQQVVEDLAQAVLVAGHLDRAGRRELHGPLGPHGGSGADGVGRQRHQLHRRHLHRHALVQASQGEEVVDQPVHAGRLGADARDDARQVLGMLGSAPLEQLGVGRHGGDGRAQLVRGVGDELAQMLLVLAQARLRGNPGREGRLNPLEHDVERAGQAADLGGLVGARNSLVEVAGGDGVGRAFHVFERAQAEPDQPPATGQREHERAGRHRQLGQEEGVQRAVLVHERLRLHQHHAAALRLTRPYPEGRAARVDRTGGEVGDLVPSGWVVKPVIGTGSCGR